tara:strand:+ start:1804 stop:2808 length:1005 start_codon:yes stop_codon:yes gene_type:complete
MAWTYLQTKGYITLPIFDTEEREELCKELQAITAKFQEFKKLEEDGLVMGGFGAFGNPSSFHNPWVRKIRSIVHPYMLNHIFDEPLKEDADLKFEQDIDRMMIRTPSQKVGKESWHRDEAKWAKKRDSIFGGWVNFDDFYHYFSACPGTHNEEDAKLKNKGFARIEKKDYPKYEGLKQAIPVAPGHILIFNERMVHEVRPSTKQTIHRLFMGWRLTYSEEALFRNGNQELDEALNSMAVVPIKSGQIPQMYASAHWNFHREKVEDWSNRMVDKCKESRVVTSGKDSGQAYTVVHRHMKSMKEYGFDLYEPYTEKEISILKPHRPVSPAKRRRLV